MVKEKSMTDIKIRWRPLFACELKQLREHYSKENIPDDVIDDLLEDDALLIIAENYPLTNELFGANGIIGQHMTFAKILITANSVYQKPYVYRFLRSGKIVCLGAMPLNRSKVTSKILGVDASLLSRTVHGGKPETSSSEASGVIKNDNP